MGHRIEKCFPAGGIFDLIRLLEPIEIIPADDAALDEPLASFLPGLLSPPAETPGVTDETARVKRVRAQSDPIAFQWPDSAPDRR